MIEERGQVMAVDGDRVRVAVERQSACGSCKARAACGQGMIQALRSGRCQEVEARCSLPVRVGDQVVLGVAEELAVRSALLVYLLPLLALLGGALLADAQGLAEGWSILSALGGFALAVGGVYLYNRRLAVRGETLAVVLRVEPLSGSTAIRWQP
ncbi:MAG: SoxR reducing system RseC family protein [Thiopseudomonas sp.]